MDNINKTKDSGMNKSRSGIFMILLVLITVAQCIFYIYLFTNVKTAHHEDEFFSYALSNSYKRPFLYGDKHQTFEANSLVRTGDDFKYSLMTNNDTRFKYDSVWYNQTEDVHPPLYYAILHTICSFTPYYYSWWYAMAINLVCFAVGQFFIYKLAKQICRNDIFALLSCLFFGFTLAGVNSAEFLRMYAMMNMFAVIYAYFSFRLFKIPKEEKCTAKDVLPVMLTAFFGALTQHLYIVLIFFITLLECVWLLCGKRIRTFFFYGFAAAIGVGASIAVFPATIRHVFGDVITYTHEPDAFIQSHQFLRLLIKETFGYEMSFYRFDGLTYFTTAMIFIIAFSAPVIFLFRKSSAVHKAAKVLKEMVIRLFRDNRELVIILAASAAFFYVLCVKVDYFSWGDDASRYLYCIVPFVCIAALKVLETVSVIWKNKKVCTALTCVSAAVCAAVLVIQNVIFDYNYVADAEITNGRIASYINNDDCVLLLKSPIFLPCFCEMLQNADTVYETVYTADEYMNEKSLEQYSKFIEEKNSIYVMFCDEDLDDKVTLDSLAAKANGEEGPEEKDEDILTSDDIIKYYEDTLGAESEYMTSEMVHNLHVNLYRFTKK